MELVAEDVPYAPLFVADYDVAMCGNSTITDGVSIVHNFWTSFELRVVPKWALPNEPSLGPISASREPLTGLAVTTSNPVTHEPSACFSVGTGASLQLYVRTRLEGSLNVRGR